MNLVDLEANLTSRIRLTKGNSVSLQLYNVTE